jgi:hypothetical protein
MITRNRFAKLLQGPGPRWMRGDVAMHDAPCPDLHQEEHLESSEPGGHYDQEIAGDDGLGVIANKRPPVLRTGPRVASSLRFRRPIGAHWARRNIDTQLHRKLRCHARLAQVGFSCAPTMSLRMLSGSRGRPARDFHFQNNLKPLRCRLISVSGLKAPFQLHRRDQRMRERDERSRSIASVGPGSPHRRPAAFAGTGSPRLGPCVSETGDGRKEARPRPDR